MHMLNLNTPLNREVIRMLNIFKCIEELYRLEADYEYGKLFSEQIGLLRQKLKTQEIVIMLRSKLGVMLSGTHSPRGELMEKALRYLDTFWTLTIAQSISKYLSIVFQK